MSRYNPRHNIDALLQATDEWKQRCLKVDGGLLTDGDYWNSACLVELDQRFIQNPLEGDESFIEKLQRQLADAQSSGNQTDGRAELVVAAVLHQHQACNQTRSGAFHLGDQRRYPAQLLVIG